MRTALERQLVLLGSPAGAVTKTLLPSDPTGELAHILSGLSMGQGPATLHGVWFSRDGTSAQLVAETTAPGFDIDQQEAAVKTIQRRLPLLRLVRNQPAARQRARSICRRIADHHRARCLAPFHPGGRARDRPALHGLSISDAGAAQSPARPDRRAWQGSRWSNWSLASCMALPWDSARRSSVKPSITPPISSPMSWQASDCRIH